MTALPHPALRLRSDAQLVSRFRAGDESAFAALHHRHAATIRSYAAFMLRGTPHDPDDAAQDVFLRAYEALRRDDRAVDVRPWLFRIAHNRCVDVLRQRPPDSLDAEQLPAGRVADLHAGHEARESLRALLRDIGALPERQRSALLLRELGGLSHEAVAHALGITVAASKMLVARARMTLTDAAEARSATCEEVRLRLAAAADASHRPARADRRHVRDCPACRACERARAGLERELALLPPGGAGLVALLGAVAGGGGAAAGTGGGAPAGVALGTKALTALCCAAVGLGAVVATTTTVGRHGSARHPQPSREPGASTVATQEAATAVAPAPARAAYRPARTIPHRAARTKSHATPATSAAVPRPERVDLATLSDPAPTPKAAPRPATHRTSQPPASGSQRIELSELDGPS